VLGLVHLASGVATAGAAGVVLDHTTAATAATTASVGVLAIFAAALIARGGWMVYAGVGDLAGGHRPAEGRVLRYRVRGADDDRRWYVAVDEGTSARIRAWRFTRSITAPQGATVRAEVGPRTGHVRGLEVVTASVNTG
jgi:hypothetical protein